MYRKNEIQLCPSPLYKCIVILVAAATLILTACGGLNGDNGEKNIRINLPPIEQSASGNSRALSDDRLPMLKTETKRYRVTVNDIVREGTESSYEFTLPVGIRATAIIECLNSSGEVIIRAVKDFTVSSGENSVDINLKNDGNEIMPASAAGRVTYSYGEADRHGNKSGIPSDPTTYSEGDLFEVKDGSGMTWDHATQQSGFAGWSASPAIEPENGGQEESSPTSGQKYKMPRGGVTLTAQWNKKSYTITYDMNAAGSGNTSSSTSINQGSVQALEDYTIDSTTPASVSAGGKNYTFMEWSDGNGNTYAVGGKITNVTGNITLMAQWSDEDVWTVTYEKGSTQASTQDITNWIASDNAVDGNSVTLPTLQAAGYTFTGWRIDGATQQGGTSYTPTVSVTATAQWTVNSYQVTYALDGGSGGPASGNVQYNASVALDAPTKTGYNFTGWSDGSTTYGGTSGNSSLTMPAQAITLTAQWTPIDYTITYNANGGGANPGNTTFTIESGNVTFAASDTLLKQGYSFVAWETTSGQDVSNMTNPADLINLMGGTTLALQAKWTELTTLYVSDSGNDTTGDGSNAKPFATVQKAIAIVNGLTGTDLTISISGTISVNEEINFSVSGKTITVSGSGTLQRDTSFASGSMIRVRLCTVKFNGPTLDGNKVKISDSGAVINISSSGVAELVSGTVKNGATSNSGGGVTVGSGSTFKMSGGTITENDAEWGGGGVNVYGTFEMTNGTISKNRASGSPGDGGGVNVDSDALFTMEDGSITENTCARAGGGVKLNGSGATFTLNGGSITNNTGTDGGGVYTVTGNTFNGTGGTLSGNIPDEYAGEAYTGSATGSWAAKDATIADTFWLLEDMGDFGEYRWEDYDSGNLDVQRPSGTIKVGASLSGFEPVCSASGGYPRQFLGWIETTDDSTAVEDINSAGDYLTTAKENMQAVFNW